MSFWKKVSAPVLLMGLASPLLVNCDGLAIPGADCPALKDGNFANLKLEGGAEVEGKLKGFLEAVYNLDKLALEMETGLIESCSELGKAMGMEGPEVDGVTPDSGEGAKKVCGAVAAKVEANISASADVTLSVEIGEPKCSVDIDAMSECLGTCGPAIDPGEFEASCEGGEISGECSGECSGSCTIEAGAECGGTCNGTCEGKCDGEDSSGSCAGKCEGSCSASCQVEGKAECAGSCSGGCSVDLKAPTCSGTFKPPSVSVDCHANCSAKLAGSATCEPPSLSIKVEGEAAAELEATVKGLEVSLPKIIAIWKGMGVKLVATGEALVKQGQELPSIASKAGLQGIACIGMAAEMAVSASASISVNVEASASVGGSVGG